MISRCAVPFLVLALAACGSEAEEPKSPEEVQAEIEKLPTQTPGLYRITTKLLDVDVADLAP